MPSENTTKKNTKNGVKTTTAVSRKTSVKKTDTKKDSAVKKSAPAKKSAEVKKTIAKKPASSKKGTESKTKSLEKKTPATKKVAVDKKITGKTKTEKVSKVEAVEMPVAKKEVEVKKIKKTTPVKKSTEEKKIIAKVKDEKTTKDVSSEELSEKKETEVKEAKKSTPVKGVPHLDRSKLIFMVAGMVLLVLALAIKELDIFKKTSTPCKHTLIYQDGVNPGSTYEMCISKDQDIVVTRTPDCENFECNEAQDKVTVENVNFKEENQQYIDRFMEKFIDGKKKVSMKLSDLYSLPQEDKVVFFAVMYDDEAFLDTLE